MEWLQNLLSGENSDPLQLVLITLFLVICLILIVWVVRRIAGSPSRRAGRGRIPRLSITDSAAVDDKRYIVMVRRDNVEHLLLIGGPTDVVVETGIVRVQPVTNPGDTMKPTSRAAEEKQVQKKSDAAKDGPLFGGNGAAAATVAASGAAAMAPAPAAETKSSKPDTPETAEEAEKTDSEADDALENVVPADEKKETNSDITVEATVDQVEEDTSKPETEAPELEPDLEDTITKNLDDVLSSEDFNIDDKPEPENKKQGKPEQDDEMQRLLEELAGETKKEPAE